MNRKFSSCLKLLPLSILAASVPANVQALGVRLPDQDAFATGRGEAFVATADNPSAIYYNPAGITQLDGENVRGGIYGIAIHDRANNNNGPGGSSASYNTQNGVQVVPQFFYTVGLDSIGVDCLKDVPVTLGLGVYLPYGLSMQWPGNTGFDELGTKASVEYVTINPVVAWKVIPGLSVAAGLTVNYAKTDLQLDSIFGSGSQTRFRGDDTTEGFNLGILYQPIDQVSLGASYHSQTKLNFRGTATEMGASPVFPNNSVNATAPFAFPQNAVAGISYRPTRDWNFEFDADWTDWHQLKYVSLSDTPLLLGGAVPEPLNIQFNWKSSWFFEFGATRYFKHGLHVSGGYIYSQNSVPDAGFIPLIPDSDRHIFSLGVGGKYKRWSWDASYQLAWGPDRTVNQAAPAIQNAPQNANGTYQFLSHAIIISAGYHF